MSENIYKYNTNDSGVSKSNPTLEVKKKQKPITFSKTCLLDWCIPKVFKRINNYQFLYQHCMSCGSYSILSVAN